MKRFFFAFLLVLAACSGKPAETERRIPEGTLVVDVRSREEAAASGIYPGAIVIPVDEAERRISEFGAKDKPVVLYCRSGNRAGRVKQMLEKNGFTSVTNAGGLTDMPGTPAPCTACR